MCDVQRLVLLLVSLDSAFSLMHVFPAAGAFVLDRVRGIAYLNISERADVGLAEQWVQDLGYRVRTLPTSLL